MTGFSTAVGVALWAVVAAPTAPRPAAPPSALEALSDAVKAQVLRAQPEAPVAVTVEGAHAELSRAVTTLLSAKLSSAHLAPMPVEGAKDAEFRALERGARTLVRVTVALEGSKLTARGDLYSLWVNFWSGQAPSRDTKAALVSASVDADPEALALAGSSPTSPTPSTSLDLKATVIAKFFGTPSAVTAVDFDQDGKSDLIAVVVNEELLAFGPDGRQLAKIDLATSAPAPLPTRDAFAALGTLVGPPRLVAWSAKRARAEVFTWAGGLKNVGTADALSVDSLSVKFEPGFNRFSSDVTWAGRATSLGAVGPQVVSSRGPLTLLVLADGTAALVRGVAPTAKVTGVGSGSTLADLDGDGTTEAVLTTSRTFGEDEVRVVSVTTFDAVASRNGTLAETTPLWQSPLNRGRALAACPAELDGLRGDEVILVTALADGSGEVVALKREVAP